MRYDAEHKDRTRRRVLRSAGRAIRARGPHRVTVAAVMSGAGLTHGGFYEHFASKDDLIEEAITYMLAGAVRRVDALRAAHAAPEALRAYVRWYLSSGHRDATDGGCPYAAMAGDFVRLSVGGRARMADGMAGWIARVASLLEGAGHGDAGGLAASVLAELLGALSLARALAPGSASDAVLAGSRQRVLGRLGLSEPTPSVEGLTAPPRGPTWGT